MVLVYLGANYTNWSNKKPLRVEPQSGWTLDFPSLHNPLCEKSNKLNDNIFWRFCHQDTKLNLFHIKKQSSDTYMYIQIQYLMKENGYEWIGGGQGC